ncbi:glutaredoxin family protein [Massilia sp. CMS3.1]|uniref:glutaredoxin family protein n=1 Tax=Massilia sp. CMS3.1 TaxID=3373083 RepID=UPI003EE4EEA6
MNHLKTVLSYLGIIAIGLAIGTIAPRVPGWIKGDYTEGNYSAYFPNPATKVVLYGTPTCPYCGQARDYLKARGVVFADYDLTTSPQGKQAYDQLKGKGVPLMLIGERRIDGFNEQAIAEALSHAGIAPRTVAQAR